MRFSKEEIEIAVRFKEHGLAWEPHVGNYVFDRTGFCQQKSPFQDDVFFILNYACFLDKVGGVDRFKELMVWLPVWENLRQILSDLGVSDTEVRSHLKNEAAATAEEERLALYQLVESCLTRQAVRSLA